MRNTARVCIALVAISVSWMTAHARNIDVFIQDSTGAKIAQASVVLRCGNWSQNKVGSTVALEMPEEKSCELVVEAPGFSSQSLTIPRNEDQVVVTLQPRPITESVTVTASRSPLSPGELPISQVNLSRDQVLVSPPIAIDDKLRQVPGFSLFRRSGSQTANPTSQGVSLRGLGASGASRSLVLEDGIPLNDPFGGWIYWGRIPVESIQSIDVVEGGTSDLYGSTALSGLINIKTRSPIETYFSGQTSFGSSSSPFTSGFGAIGKGKWHAAISGESFDTNGYINVPESARGLVDTPVSSQHQAGSVVIEHASKRMRTFLRGSLYGESRQNGTIEQFNNATIRQIAFGSDLQNAWGAFSVRAYGGTQNYHQTFSAVAQDRNSETVTIDQRVPVQQYGFSAQWSRPVGRHLLTSGADGRDVTGDTNELQYAANAYFIAGGRQQSLGLYLEDIFQVTNRWLFSGSIRGDIWSNSDASSRRFPFSGPPILTYFPDRSETSLSPRIGLTRIVNDRLSFYVSAYRAFRAPTLNELYRSFRVGNIATLANPDLKAEHFTGGELGATVAPSSRLQLQATLFTGYLSNAVGNITLSATPSLITRQRQNLGQTRTTGLQLHLQTKLRNDLLLSADYQFIDAKILEFAGDPTLIGLRTPQVPRNSFLFQATYANPKVLTVSLQGRAIGTEYDDDRNQLVLDPYFNLGLYVSRNLWKHVAMFAASENLLNSRYVIGRTPLETLAAPISARVGLRFEFGATSDAK